MDTILVFDALKHTRALQFIMDTATDLDIILHTILNPIKGEISTALRVLINNLCLRSPGPLKIKNHNRYIVSQIGLKSAY